MTAADLLRAVTAAGVTLRVDGDRLALRPASRLSPDLLAEVRRLKPELIALLRALVANDPLERRARELLEEAKGTHGVTITDEEGALAYYRAVARLVARGEDEEREAIQAEERGRVVDLPAHRRTIEGLLRTASPVASLPGAVRCRRCGAGVWAPPHGRGRVPPFAASANVRGGDDPGPAVGGGAADRREHLRGPRWGAPRPPSPPPSASSDVRASGSMTSSRRSRRRRRRCGR